MHTESTAGTDIRDCDGYKKLLSSAMRDAESGENCFNPDGCNQSGRTKCTHQYCSKFKWVLDRATHYAEKTGLSAVDVLNAWEKGRDYWYMNYYQEANQPEIKADTVRLFDTQDDLRESVGTTGFRCPSCGGVSKSAYVCDSGLPMNKKGEICNWKSYGLFGTMGKGIYVFVKDKLKGQNIFMPVAWEGSNGTP